MLRCAFRLSCGYDALALRLYLSLANELHNVQIKFRRAVITLDLLEFINYVLALRKMLRCAVRLFGG